jgi:hypothetical protein
VSEEAAWLGPGRAIFRFTCDQLGQINWARSALALSGLPIFLVFLLLFATTPKHITPYRVFILSCFSTTYTWHTRHTWPPVVAYNPARAVFLFVAL